MKIVTVVGARPQFVKAWPVSIALEKKGIDEKLIHTGQHYDSAMSDIFFEEFGMRKPDHMLDFGGGGHGEMTGQMLIAIEKYLLSEKPDAVLVYGDTNSTLAGALAASKLLMKVVHIEAGLRSRNKDMPEEQNRILTDHISSMLLCPTALSIENLRTENITDNVHKIGDVMFDSTQLAKVAAVENSDILGKLGLRPNSYSVMTVHRAENTNTSLDLENILNWVCDNSSNEIILPVHPRVHSMLKEINFKNKSLRVINPIGYIDMNALLMNCSEVYTDSGGLQKEAYFHKKRCTTLREETEWVETIESGWNRLMGEKYLCGPKDIPEYGNGNAAEIAVNYIQQLK